MRNNPVSIRIVDCTYSVVLLLCPGLVCLPCCLGLFTWSAPGWPVLLLDGTLCTDLSDLPGPLVLLDVCLYLMLYIPYIVLVLYSILLYCIMLLATRPLVFNCGSLARRVCSKSCSYSLMGSHFPLLWFAGFRIVRGDNFKFCSVYPIFLDKAGPCNWSF